MLAELEKVDKHKRATTLVALCSFLLSFMPKPAREQVFTSIEEIGEQLILDEELQREIVEDPEEETEN